jgi:hypothetical protein
MDGPKGIYQTVLQSANRDYQKSLMVKKISILKIIVSYFTCFSPEIIMTPTPPSSCPRSYQMPPFM